MYTRAFLLAGMHLHASKWLMHTVKHVRSCISAGAFCVSTLRLKQRMANKLGYKKETSKYSTNIALATTVYASLQMTSVLLLYLILPCPYLYY
jgi:hypothetical protein